MSEYTVSSDERGVDRITTTQPADYSFIIK
jgi:hypothetical protein